MIPPEMRLPRLLSLSVACIVVGLAFQSSFVQAEVGTPPFRADDRWSIVGDSITHNGTWHTLVRAFYITRYPGLSFQAFNAGIAGDKTSGALRRYDWDIKAENPTVATIMLGMNDVDRELYDKEPSPAVEAQRAEALAKYEGNMTRLVDQMRADGIRVILITPSIFDETAELPTARQAGTNVALGKCAEFLRSLSQKPGVELVDFYGPMNQLNRERQKVDPTFTLIGNDRVHPQSPGHLVMAYLFIKSYHPPVVSTTSIDAKSLSVLDAVNVTVRDLQRTAEGLSFSSLEGSLPFPIDPEAAIALEWMPAIRDLNRETLQVRNLDPGNYELAIDGTVIRSFSHDELAQGINLAEEVKTPQNIQARSVLELLKQYRTLENQKLRSIAQTEQILLKDLPRPIDLAAAAPIIEKRLQDLKVGNAPRAAYYTNLFERYMKIKPKVSETRDQLADLSKRINATSRPVEHRFTLAKSPSGLTQR